MAWIKSFFNERATLIRWLACGFAAALFTWNASQFYVPGKGFTCLIEFGDKLHGRVLPEIRAINHFEFPDSFGYDSQYYAQIALRPNLGDPALRTAVDNLPYRARRILFCWTAWIAGGGQPILVLNAYAVQAIVCWFLLAILLFRWFPPTRWGNWFRWMAVLFSFGLAFSVRGALVDGPSLLLIAAAMALIESGQGSLGAAVLGISGLGKETNLLAAVSLGWPVDGTWKTWRTFLVRWTLVAAPLAIWLICLRIWLGHAGDLGQRNFAAPFTGLVEKIRDSLSEFIAGGFSSWAKYNLLVLLGLLAQFSFFAFRRRWTDPWWRIGAAYALLMVFLGPAVWEGYPGAAARVLLPMTLAFNVLVPRGRGWALLLLVGNVGMMGTPDVLEPPGLDTKIVRIADNFRISPVDGQIVSIGYTGNWYLQEKSRSHFWRWSRGACSLSIHNPQAFPIDSTICFDLRSEDPRSVRVDLKDKVIWQGRLQAKEVTSVVLSRLRLEPGDTLLRFDSDRPAFSPGNGDARRLSFALGDLRVDLLGVSGSVPGP